MSSNTTHPKKTVRIVPRKELNASSPAPSPPVELLLGQNHRYEYLYQLSDVHIPPIRRHSEYRLVFEQVYRQLRASPAGLIVLTGDIVDAKIKVTNELLILLYEFLHNLAEIMPVILIPGNHDLNIREKDRIDTLLGALLNPGGTETETNRTDGGPVSGPKTRKLDNPKMRLDSKPVSEILAEIEKKGYLYGKYCRIANLVYLRKSGGYRIGNLIFGLSSFLDDQVYPAKCILKPPIAGEVDYLIGLAHLSLYEAIYSTGIRHLSRKYTLETFRGYDFVLLGDIHQPQFMNKEHTVGYPGSLLQINFGEPLTGHGYLKWDLKAGRGEMQIVKNPRGFLKIRFEAGQLINKSQVLNELAEVEEVRLRIYHDLKTDRATIDQFLNSDLKVRVLESKRIADRISVRSKDGLVNLGQGKLEFENLYQLETQLNYLKSYLETKAVATELIAKILDIHRETYKSVYSENRVDNSETSGIGASSGIGTSGIGASSGIGTSGIGTSGIGTAGVLGERETAGSETSGAIANNLNDFEWRIRCLKFKNIFCYRGSNQINFQELRGLIGILGNNSLGKSTIMDIILFTIFNKCDRVDLTNREDLLTKGENSGWIEMTIEEGGMKNADSGTKNLSNLSNLNTGSELILFLEIKRQINGSVRINRSYFRRKDTELVQIGGNSEVAQMTKLFGDYQTFVMVHVKLQSNIGELGSAGARDQHTILHKLLKLDCFKNMVTIVTQELADLRKKLKSLERTMAGKDTAEKITLELSEKKNEFLALENRRHGLEQDLKTDQQTIDALYQARQNLVAPSLNDNGLQVKVLRLSAKIELLESQLKKFNRSQLEELVAKFRANSQNESDSQKESESQQTPILAEDQVLVEDQVAEQVLVEDQVADQVLKITNFQHSLKHNIAVLEQIDLETDTSSGINQILTIGLPTVTLPDFNHKFKLVSDQLVEMNKNIRMLQKSYLQHEKALQLSQYHVNYDFLEKLHYRLDCIDCQNNQKIIRNELNNNNNLNPDESNLQQTKSKLIEARLSKLDNLKALTDSVALIYQEACQNLDKIRKHNETRRKHRETEKLHILRKAEIEKRELIDHESRLQNLEKFYELDQCHEDLKPLVKDLKLIENVLLEQKQVYQKDLQNYEKKLEIAKLCLEAREEEFHEIDQVYQSNKLAIFWLEKQLLEAQTNENELIQIENRSASLKIYAEAISEKGILKQVVTDKLELMSELINNIVQSMDPAIKIELEYNEQGFQLLLVKQEQHFNYKILGGFEKFLVNLALKIALSTVSNVSKPNFVCIDEGWGSADFNHRNNLDLFLENLAQRYEMILIVSHIPELIDLLENNRLPIYERPEGGSVINNSGLSESEIQPIVPVTAFSGRDRSMDRPKSQKNPRKTVELKIV